METSGGEVNFVIITGRIISVNMNVLVSVN